MGRREAIGWMTLQSIKVTRARHGPAYFMVPGPRNRALLLRFVLSCAGEAPVGAVAGALDAISAALGVAHLERLHLLHLEGGLVDPGRASGARLVERVRDDVDRLRLARQRDEAAVGARLFRVV